jgi:hypothetical protein
MESTTSRETGGLNLSADFGRTKTKARQCLSVELATGCKAPGSLARNNKKKSAARQRLKSKILYGLQSGPNGRTGEVFFNSIF